MIGFLCSVIRSSIFPFAKHLAISLQKEKEAPHSSNLPLSTVEILVIKELRRPRPEMGILRPAHTVSVTQSGLCWLPSSGAHARACAAPSYSNPSSPAKSKRGPVPIPRLGSPAARFSLPARPGRRHLSAPHAGRVQPLARLLCPVSPSIPKDNGRSS